MSDSRALVPFQAPPPPVLVDTSGRPLRRAYETLTSEIAAPTLTGIRSIVSGHPAQGLDPIRLTQILRSAEQGDATAYLELAEEIEEKYGHYQSVMGTRKRAVAQLPIRVEAAGDSEKEEVDAQLVRDWLKRPTLQSELRDIMDADGKGYSATEIIWGLSASTWLPTALKWRDPRFFEFDQATGEQLLLKGGIDGHSGLPQPLPPYKFITHVSAAKSGLPIRGGIARTIAWTYLFLNFTIKDWITFLEVYGLPLRVGKYQNGTSEDDVRKLAQAVAQIGSDAGCVIPQSMMIEFVQSGGAAAANPEMFSRFIQYADDATSKVVLGQTSSADAKSGGLGSGQAGLHGEVRQDIRDAGAMELSATLSRDLAVPIVMFNRGERARYPQIIIGEIPLEDLDRGLKGIEAAVRLGVPVGVTYFRKVTGVPAPEDGEEVLAQRAANPQGEIPPDLPNGPPAGLSSPLKRESTREPKPPSGEVAAAASKFIAAAVGLVAARSAHEQPREPAGTTKGGQWASSGGGALPVAAPGKLNAADKQAVFDYSVMHYHKINEHARGEADHGSDTAKRIAALDKAVGKGVLQEDTILYRGVSDTGVKALKKAGLAEGSILEDAGFTSTSRDRDVVKHNFAEARGSITLQITAKRGTKALDIAKHSAVEMEQEVLLPRGNRMRVLKWDAKSRTLHVEALSD